MSLVERVDEFVNSRKHLDPKTVHNHLTLLISMLTGAIDLKWLREKPRIKKPKIPMDDYTYLTTEDEIRRFLDAAKDGLFAQRTEVTQLQHQFFKAVGVTPPPRFLEIMPSDQRAAGEPG